MNNGLAEFVTYILLRVIQVLILVFAVGVFIDGFFD